MCESDERHTGGWAGTGGARLAYCNWLIGGGDGDAEQTSVVI